MSQEDTNCLSENLLRVLEDFINGSKGIELEKQDNVVELRQNEDGKQMRFELENLFDILLRKDREGRNFLQLNFNDGKKVLVTDSLIGFKPLMRENIEYGKMPNVVTTPDLISVFEAIEEGFKAQDKIEDLSLLRNVYYAILEGAESIGFEMNQEKSWLQRAVFNYSKSA